MQPLEFLGIVWGERRGWVDVPSKINGHWTPFSAEWPDDRGVVERRVRDCVGSGEDVYFSVGMFGARGRRIADTLSCGWLWADLDTVGPDDCAGVGLMPTVCWESSPFRFQALWRLGARVGARALERLNRALTYRVGGDRGGWDLTQVLRPVGTYNFKYGKEGHEVLLVYDDGPTYDPRKLWRELGVEGRGDGRGGGGRVQGHEDAPALGRRLPARARALLATPAARVVVGERSARLWELNCLLGEAGLDEGEIFALVVDTPWNKWAGRGDTGGERLRRDIRKALDRVRTRSGGAVGATDNHARVTDGDSGDDEGEGLDLSRPSNEVVAERKLPFVGYSSFMASSFVGPRWLIEGLWMNESHGIIGGDPKSSKSFLSLAMGLSIASGRPFLGVREFAVRTAGPVLIVQEENTPWDLQDRLRKLAWLYGLIGEEDVEREDRSGRDHRDRVGETVRLAFPADCPLWVLNNYGFDLMNEDHRAAIEDTIRNVRPVCVVFDPLYLMLGSADADKAGDVRELQKWLIGLRYTYGVAVMIVHHFRKPSGDRGGSGGGGGVASGHRLLGSTTWYNWIDSALYLEVREPLGVGDRGQQWNRVLRVERQWRSAPDRAALDINLAISEPGELEMDVRIGAYNQMGLVRELVYSSPGITLTALAEGVGVSKDVLRRRIVGGGELVLAGGRRGRGYSWKVYPPGLEPKEGASVNGGKETA